ncbi:AfsA-related hotdog domain-containing protein [Micromonospora sp. NPDC005215]|uniref:AfsA-related hotdog domain-containing protein n=1 Tax=Micromonospora sp. NPDC005215 TaxID=3157024 RepID=UPI0033BF9F1D
MAIDIDSTAQPTAVTQPPVPSALGLTTDSTVPRRFAHRQTTEGVFVTGVARDGERLVAVGQLPRLHRLYNDTPGRHHDTLLIAEVLRQGVEVIAHALLEVPLDSQFVLRSVDVRVESTQATIVGEDTAEIVIAVPVDRVRRNRRGAVYAIDGPVRAWIDGRPAATMTGSVAFLAHDGYAELRSGSAERVLKARPELLAMAAPGAVVGRRFPGNVLITTPSGPPQDASADVLPLRHPAFFDRRLDHYPGMLIAEASRQLAVAAMVVHADVDAGSLRTDAASMDFVSFAELDAALSCRVAGWDTDGSGQAVTVWAEQKGQVVTRSRFVLSPEETPGPELGS